MLFSIYIFLISSLGTTLDTGAFRQEYHSFRTKSATIIGRDKVLVSVIISIFFSTTYFSGEDEKLSATFSFFFTAKQERHIRVTYGASQNHEFFKYHNGSISRYGLQRGEARKRFHLNGTNKDSPWNTRNKQSHLPVGQRFVEKRGEHRVGLSHNYGMTERGAEVLLEYVQLIPGSWRFFYMLSWL